MKTKLAIAVALVVAGIGAGVSTVPGAATSQTVCDQDDFSIPSSEPLVARELAAGESEVGTVDVDANDPKKLRVKLTDEGVDGNLHWVVKYDRDQSCDKLDPMDCEGNISTSPTKQTCTLDDPSSGTRTYHVLFEETNLNNAIKYKPWAN